MRLSKANIPFYSIRIYKAENCIQRIYRVPLLCSKTIYYLLIHKRCEPKYSNDYKWYTINSYQFSIDICEVISSSERLPSTKLEIISNTS
jgi:hypothetical protein